MFVMYFNFSAMNVHMVTDEEEEEVDTFHKMEAGISDNRYSIILVYPNIAVHVVNWQNKPAPIEIRNHNKSLLHNT